MSASSPSNFWMKNKTETLLFMVVHPVTVPFLKCSLDSLSRQDEPDFDLLLLLDEVHVPDVEGILAQVKPLNVTMQTESASIAGNRKFGIDFATRLGYQHLVFCDGDDTFASNRVRISKQILKEKNVDFVVNDLNIVDSEGKILCENYYENRLEDGFLLPSDFLLERNICGLSNTAVRVSSLRDIFIPDHLVAVDWYLFSVLLLKGCSGCFTAETITYYRQHSANCLGIGKVSESKVGEMMRMKRDHLEALAGESEVYASLFRRFTAVGNKFENEAFQMRLRKVVTDHSEKFPFWWESLITSTLENV